MAVATNPNLTVMAIAGKKHNQKAQQSGVVDQRAATDKSLLIYLLFSVFPSQFILLALCFASLDSVSQEATSPAELSSHIW